MKHMRLLGTLLMTLVLCLAVSCSDDDAKSDGSVKKDSGASDSSGLDTGAADTGGQVDATKQIELSCSGENPCEACCPEDDSTCLDACADALSAAAKKQKEDFQTCMETTCGNDCGSSGTKQDCLSCIETQCAEEHAACDWGANGSSSCGVAYSCFIACPRMTLDHSGSTATCPQDPGLVCMQQCFYDANQEAGQLLDAVGACSYQHCNAQCTTDWLADVCQSCLDQQCTSQMQACEEDK